MLFPPLGWKFRGVVGQVGVSVFARVRFLLQRCANVRPVSDSRGDFIRLVLNAAEGVGKTLMNRGHGTACEDTPQETQRRPCGQGERGDATGGRRDYSDRGRSWAIGLLALSFLALALSACGVADVPQSTLMPQSDNARLIQNLWGPIFWAAVVIFVLVEGLLIYSVIRFPARRQNGEDMPPQIHGNTRLEMAWTLAPALVVAVMLILTFQTMAKIDAAPPEDALRVRVVGHQWWWEVHYPEYNVVTANEIHLPVNRPVVVELESADVIHSFWVPRLMGKRDLIPGTTNRIWFTPLEAGSFSGQCAEYCGVAHAQMRVVVFVDSGEAFQQWIAKAQQPAPAVAGPAAQGAELFIQRGCAACHTIAGTAAQGVIEPNLTHVGGRSTLAAGIIGNTPENLARWLRDPQAVKPGNKMPTLPLSEEDITALVAYLQALP